MCLYPKLIINKKYTPTKKNGGNIPDMQDNRVKYVPIGCGNCIECRKQKAREWQVRLSEEIRHDKSGKFVTLTFSPEELEKLCDETELKECNAVATKAVRRFTERWRKQYKQTIKHWLITELGHQGTERIHLHGILFTNETNEKIKELWKYGNIYVGQYVNQKTINYIVKYVTKCDTDHKSYKSIILTSKGIGKQYTESINFVGNKYNERETNELYKLPSGHQIAIPIYYRNKRYNEEEREKLWLYKLDKNERYILGNKIQNFDTLQGIKQYERILERAQQLNKSLGYGDDGGEWKKEEYNITIQMLKKQNNRK